MSLRLLLCLPAMLVLSGCPNDATLHGDIDDPAGNPLPAVVDIQGHGLPGVAVVVYGTESQAVTDARGQYRLNAPLGSLQLDFIKTGYTPARVIVETGGETSINVPQAVMWPLPDSQGVYAFENGRYRSLTRVEPRRFLAGETQSVFGSKKAAESFIDPEKMPMLILYRLPGYDLQLCKLTQRDLTPADAGQSAKGYTVPVWTVERRIAMHVQPVDSPQALLSEVMPDEELPPGDYAIHWGAFDGFSTTEARAYLFRLVSENEVTPPPSETEGAKEETEDLKKTDSAKKSEVEEQDDEEVQGVE